MSAMREADLVISGGLLVASVLSVALSVWQHRRQQQRRADAGEDADF